MGALDGTDGNSNIKWDTDYTGGITYGGVGHSAAEDLSLSRTRQAQAVSRKADPIDYTSANASLANAAALQQQDAALSGQQGGALSSLQAQASGATPSAAGISAGINSQAGLAAALQGMAGGHSSLANAAGARQALAGGQQMQLSNAQMAAGARQQEFNAANGALGSFAGDARQGDYASALSSAKAGSMQGQMANAQAQQNLQQQQMNQQYAEAQMQQRYGIGQIQVQGEQAAINRLYSDQAQGYQNSLAQQQMLMGLVGAGAQAAGSLGAAAATYGGSSGGGSGYQPNGNAAMAGSGINNSASSFNQAYAMPTSPSDERTKEAAWDVAPLYEPEGMQLHQGFDGRAFYQNNPQEPQTIGRGMAVPSLASAAEARAPEKLQQMAAHPTKKREMSYDELMAAADKEIASVNTDSARRQAGPTAVDPGVLADANRKMAGQPYRYKPEFVPPDEVPGQIHHGFMAQNLEQNPVTATAVEEGPDGMKRVNHARMIQAMASGVSDLQRQVDEMRGGR